MSRSLKVAVVVSIATVALLCAMIEHGRTIRATAPLRALPSTARAVLRIDTEALRRTAAAEVLLGTFVAREQLTEIEKTCGIAPLEALSDITLWVQGPDDQPFQSVGLMLKGRSANARRLAQCHRLLVEARGGSVVRLDAPIGPLLTSRDRRSAIALLDDRTVVTGSVQTVAEAMGVAHGVVPALVDRASFAALWGRVSLHSAVAAVIEPPEDWNEALESLGRRDAERSALEGVRAFALAIRSGSKGTVEVHLDVANPEAIHGDTIEIEAWLHDPPDSVEPPWADVLRTGRVREEGQTIQINLDVSSLAKAP